ncbi:MAG: TonB-dependent receptor [Alphaproteobacteria bacterium]
MKSSFHKVLFCGVSSLAIYGLGITAAAAQQASDNSSSDTIVVTGIRESMRNSIAVKRNSDLVTDNISTEDIGQLPDVTIAEELNRLPGVNTTRDRGNASQAAVRGLGPRLVFGLVNGREVASSEPSQSLRWEIYPSEVLSGAQVYKSQDASLIPGGIAATIDIRTIHPLEYHGAKFNVQAGPTYNQQGSYLPDYSPWGYRASAAYIAHLSSDFAVAIAASSQREKNGFPNFHTFGWNDPTGAGTSPGDLNGDGTPDATTWGLVNEVKEVVQDRDAIMAAAGWQPTDHLTVNFDSLYSKYTIDEHTAQTWYGNNITGNWANGNSLEYNAPGNSYQIVNGSVVAAHLACADPAGSNYWQCPNYQSNLAHYSEQHKLTVLGLNAKWTDDNWDASLDLSHSEANRVNNWQNIAFETVYAPELDFNLTHGQTPSASMPGFNALADVAVRPGTVPGPFFSNRDGQAGPAYTDDAISAIRLDATRHLHNSFFSAIDFGVRSSDREKKYHDYLYNLCAGSTTSGSCDANAQVVDLSNDGVSTFFVHGYSAPPVLWGNWEHLWSIAYPANGVPANSEEVRNRTDTEEKSNEAYVKVDFETQGAVPVTGNFGVHVADVDTTAKGFSSDGGVLTPVSIKNSYTDWLPSLNLNFHLSDDTLFRVGVSQAISRPPLDALVASFTLNPIISGQPPTASGGNPTLMPYKADQLDLSYEWYFHEESMFAVAAYYKHLENFIGAGSNAQTINGVQYIVTNESNGKGGDIEGLELTYQTRFYFLPGILQDFGIYANYAYVHSDIKEFAPATNPYSMVGLVKNTAELDLSYNHGPFEARLAYKYHSPFTVAPTWVGTTLAQIDAERTLDASLSYDLNDHISFRFQAHNITDEPAITTTDNNIENLGGGGNTTGYDIFGRSFLFDVAIHY